MGKQIKSKAKVKVNVSDSLTESINEVMFVDITRVSIDYSEDVHLQAFGSLSYNDGVKDVKVNNVNIELDVTQLQAILGTQLADLEAIIEKVAINQIAGKLKLNETDFEKKAKINKVK